MFNVTRRLALSNLKKNRELYLPFGVAAMAAITVFYLFTSLLRHPSIGTMRGGDAITTVLNLGQIVVAIASVMMIIYANNVVIKNRMKELGLYNALGLERRHLQTMMFIELLVFGLVTIVIGLITGVVFDKISSAIFSHITRLDHVLTPQISVDVMLEVMRLFAIVYVVIFIMNSIIVARIKPIELLKESKRGDRKIRFGGIRVIIALAALGWAYYVAQTVVSPVKAISLFFFAVLAVIYGTYELFTVGSVKFLQFLQKRKNIYYRSENFVAISNLIFRMRKNAMGLATICVLSTMAIVTLVSGISMYFGAEDFVKSSTPNDFNIIFGTNHLDNSDKVPTEDAVKQFLDAQQVPYDEVITATYVAGVGEQTDHAFALVRESPAEDGVPGMYLVTLTAETYQRLTGQQVQVGAGEVAVYESKPSITGDNITFENHTLRVTSRLDETVISKIPNLTPMLSVGLKVFVVDDLESVFGQHSAPPLNIISRFTYYGIKSNMQVKNAEEYTNTFGQALNNRFASDLDMTGETDFRIFLSFDTRAAAHERFFTMLGAILYIAALLSLMFVLATVLVIYYKQISEGYEDRSRFNILHKVGFTPKDVNRSIRKQVLIVFFLPIVVALMHTFASAHMIGKIVQVIVGLGSIQTIYTNAAIIGGLFLASYVLVYALTAQRYKKIVGKKS